MKKEEKKENELVEQKKALPAEIATREMMAVTTETGFENVSSEDTAIPFIGLLQSLSPQVKRGPGHVDGAEEGMLFNSVTLEVYRPPITVIPCAFKKAWVEWKPRETGGGFVAEHADATLLQTCTRDTKNNDVLPNGNVLVPTAYHFVLIVKPDGSLERAVISMARTQLKKSRRWMSQMMSLQIKNAEGKLFTPPMFSHSYEVGSVLETKDQYSWQNFQVGNAKIIQDPEIFKTAVLFHRAVVGGKVKASQPVEDTPAANVPESDLV